MKQVIQPLLGTVLPIYLLRLVYIIELISKHYTGNYDVCNYIYKIGLDNLCPWLVGRQNLDGSVLVLVLDL